MAEEGPLTAAEIYEQITGGKGLQSLSEAQTNAAALTQRLCERAEQVYKLTEKTRAGWTGAAGDSAAAATLPLIQASADDAEHLNLAQSAVSDQMTAFGTAKNTVKPVAAQQPELTSEDIENVLTGNGWNSYNTKIASWQADSQANIDAFSAYHSASTQNGTQMPTEYAQLTDTGTSISMAPAGSGAPKKSESYPPPDGRPPGGAVEWMDKRKPAAPGPGQPGPGQPGRPSPGQPGPGQPGRPSPGQPGQPGGAYPGGAPGSDATKANNYVPKPVMPPAASAGYQFGPTGEPISNLGGSPGYSGGYGPSGGFGPGTGGYSPGTGGYRGSGATNEPGRGMGPGSGARTPEERMAGGRGGTAGAAGARGANGMPMGAGGAGRGKKEEDKEKKAAAYLQNPDPDETFGGTEVKPMPPVIGERQQKR